MSIDVSLSAVGFEAAKAVYEIARTYHKGLPSTAEAFDADAQQERTAESQRAYAREFEQSFGVSLTKSTDPYIGAVHGTYSITSEGCSLHVKGDDCALRIDSISEMEWQDIKRRGIPNCYATAPGYFLDTPFESFR